MIDLLASSRSPSVIEVQVYVNLQYQDIACACSSLEQSSPELLVITTVELILKGRVGRELISVYPEGTVKDIIQDALRGSCNIGGIHGYFPWVYAP